MSAMKDLHTAALEQAELASAQRDLAVAYLRRLLACRKGIEHTTQEEQAAIRGARALIAEVDHGSR